MARSFSRGWWSFYAVQARVAAMPVMFFAIKFAKYLISMSHFMMEERSLFMA